jgi:hypothetical protein
MKIELTKNQGITLGSLLVFAENPRSSVTRQLTEIYCKIEAGKLTAWATDRYCLVQFTDTLEQPDCEFRLTYNQAKFLKTNLKAKYSGPVEIVLEDSGSVTVSLDYGTQRLTESPSQAKYPALETLLEGWQASTEAIVLNFRIDLLAKLDQVKINGQAAEVWQLEAGLNKHNPSKPGPLKATYGSQLTALVQPNLRVS